MNRGVVQVAVDGIREDKALQDRRRAEGDSRTRMVAQTIRGYVQGRELSPAPVSQFESLAGRGVKALVDGKTYYIGGPRLLEQLKLTVSAPLDAAGTKCGNSGSNR